jgi:hypothetical protein
LGVIALVLKTQLACIATTLCASTLAWLLLKEENQIAWFHQRATQQLVGPERRERVSHRAWCGEGCVDTRRPVNSAVGSLRNSL